MGEQERAGGIHIPQRNFTVPAEEVIRAGMTGLPAAMRRARRIEDRLTSLQNQARERREEILSSVRDEVSRFVGMFPRPEYCKRFLVLAGCWRQVADLVEPCLVTECGGGGDMKAAFNTWMEICRLARRAAQEWESWDISQDLEEINLDIDRHNEFFPIEARLRIDVKTGEYVRSYRKNHVTRKDITEGLDALLSVPEISWRDFHRAWRLTVYS